MTSSAPSRPVSPAAASAAAAVSSWLEVAPRTAWIAGGIFAAGYLLTFWDFLRNQAVQAVTQPSDWGHTLLIPAISGYFVWLRRDQLLAMPFRPSWWGIAIFLLGMSIYMLSAFGPPAVQHHNVRGLGAAVALLGGSLGFFYVEQGVNPHMDTYADSLWWALVTVTTIGYGDIYPVTNAGRLVASMMMIVGIGCVSILTGTIASNLLKDCKCPHCGGDV